MSHKTRRLPPIIYLLNRCPLSLGALNDGRFGHLPSSRAMGSRLNGPSSLVLGAPFWRLNHVLYSAQRGRELDENGFQFSSEGGSEEIQSPPGFWSFFRSPGDLRRHVMFAVLVCLIWLKRPRGPGTLRGRRHGRVPLGCRTGRTIGTPIRFFFCGLENKKKCVCFPRAHVTHQSEPDVLTAAPFWRF